MLSSFRDFDCQPVAGLTKLVFGSASNSDEPGSNYRPRHEKKEIW